ncbi:hypothetical protein [Chryseobacterium sp. 2R14A]|uniref:hypothetical protein n=1 Tax=Chryseobacterium sp. 2R14A TaxID=3380353 RepID=UPI003CEC81EA
MNFKIKIFVIIISFVGILYIPFKLFVLKSNLVGISGKVTVVKKSFTRIPFYRFRITDYSNEFYNDGTGLLSNLKDDKKILYNTADKQITFFVNKNDLAKLEYKKDIQYIGLQKENVFIDIFYYYFSKFGKIPFFIFCILMMCLNAYAIYTFKSKIFEFLLIAYLLYGILILVL